MLKHWISTTIMYMVYTLIFIREKSLYVYNFNLFNMTSCPNFKTVANYKWVFRFFDGFIKEFLSYFISYFNDTIDRLAFIQQKVLSATDNKEISVATLLNDNNLPCSYKKKFSEQDSCKPSRIVSFLWYHGYLIYPIVTSCYLQPV